MSGLNASLSFIGGSVLAWGFVGPLLVRSGAAHGVAQDPDMPEWGMSYNSLKLKDPVGAPSPRYWNLWVAIMVMLCASFAEIGMNAPQIYRGMKRAFLDNLGKIPATRDYAAKRLESTEPAFEDPSPESELVPTWTWFLGVLLAIFVTCLVLGLPYHINVGITILSVIMAFAFSFIAGQAADSTDINPVSTCAKASQLVLGGVTQGQHLHGVYAEGINMIGGVVAGGAASQSVDMLGDLRTGFLLGASPRVQFYAQAVGAGCSIFLCTGFFILFTKAYPCIIDSSYDKCQFGIPSVAAWAAVSKAVSGTTFPIPTSSAVTALLPGLFSIALTVVKYKWIPQKYHIYIPNMNAAGLAFSLLQTYYSTAMAFGATGLYIWMRRSPNYLARLRLFSSCRILRRRRHWRSD